MNLLDSGAFWCLPSSHFALPHRSHPLHLAWHGESQLERTTSCLRQKILLMTPQLSDTNCIAKLPAQSSCPRQNKSGLLKCKPMLSSAVRAPDQNPGKECYNSESTASFADLPIPSSYVAFRIIHLTILTGQHQKMQSSKITQCMPIHP